MALTVDQRIAFLLTGFTIDAGQQAIAVEMAEQYRPACLTDGRADEAVAYYAAWLLYGQLQATAAASAGVVPVGVVEESLGDQSRKYATSSDAAASTADPMGFRARWAGLAALCGRGAIVAGCAPPWPR